MAMNLRLPDELACELRALSEETGRSQQELVREAIEEFVREYPLRAYPKDLRHIIIPAPPPSDEQNAARAEIFARHPLNELSAAVAELRDETR
jgi:metal-responsive CopG/Arc/MetJ family transcriptional regulator